MKSPWTLCPRTPNPEGYNGSVMTTGTDLIQAIFQDACDLQADALAMLSQGADPQRRLILQLQNKGG